MSEKAAAIPYIAGACCCFGMVFAVALTLSLKYGTLYDQAIDYNRSMNNFEFHNYPKGYDNCGGIFGLKSYEVTGWTNIFKYN